MEKQTQELEKLNLEIKAISAMPESGYKRTHLLYTLTKRDVLLDEIYLNKEELVQ